MKLIYKMVLLVVIPLVALGGVLTVVASDLMRTEVYNAAYNGMHATTLTVRNVFDAGRSGEFHISEDGKLWKGDEFNISDAYDVVDTIKESTELEVTVFYGDTRYLTTIVKEDGQRDIGSKASDAVVESVLNRGEDYQDDNVVIGGERYIAYYTPLYQENTTTPIGMIFLGQKYSQVSERIEAAQRNLLLISVILLAASSLVAILIMTSITRAINKGIKTVKTLADGRLGVGINKKLLARRDEIGDMCRSIGELDGQLCDIIKGIQGESDQVLEAANHMQETVETVAENMNQMNIAVDSISIASTQQADEAAEAGESVKTMARALEDTETEIVGLGNQTSAMADSAKMAGKTLIDLNHTMQQVKEAINLVYNQTEETNQAISQIEDITHLITSIASQTNLLSLNASIEAARAGEHGRGFAVVASEIQELSGQSNRSAAEIQGVLARLTETSEKTVHVMEKVQETITAQELKIEETNQAFNLVTDGVNNANGMLATIRQKTEVLEQARNSTTDVVTSVAAIAEENAASTEQTAAGLEEVNEMMDGITKSTVTLNDVAVSLKQRLSAFEIVNE